VGSWLDLIVFPRYEVFSFQVRSPSLAVLQIVPSCRDSRSLELSAPYLQTVAPKNFMYGTRGLFVRVLNVTHSGTSTRGRNSKG